MARENQLKPRRISASVVVLGDRPVERIVLGAFAKAECTKGGNQTSQTRPHCVTRQSVEIAPLELDHPIRICSLN